MTRARVEYASRERGVRAFCAADIGFLFVGCNWRKMRQGWVSLREKIISFVTNWALWSWDCEGFKIVSGDLDKGTITQAGRSLLLICCGFVGG